MGRELYDTQPTFRRVVDRCDAVVRSMTGESLIAVLYGNDHADLIDQTGYAQPALFAVAVGLAAVWRSWGIEPSFVMGHSVGEYAAACVSGVFSVEDGTRLVCARGRLMQGLAEGTMVAVVAERREVDLVLEKHGEAVAVAAINGPRHVVIAGVRAATDAVVAELERGGVKCQPLTVSHAFHSAMMAPMLGEFLAVAKGVTYSSPQVRLISNVTGGPAHEEVMTADYWVEHVQRPVQFAQGIATLEAEGAAAFVEIGPKPTLLALGRACWAGEMGHWLPSLRPGCSDWKQMLESLSRLYVAGVEVSWTGFDQDAPRQRVALPTYPFQHVRSWLPSTQKTTPSLKPRPDGACHPLLGRRLNLAARQDEFFFESQVSAESPAFLKDHRVNGKAVFPAAGYIEMVLAAGGTALNHPGACVLENVTFSRPLILRPSQSNTIQLHVSKSEQQIFSFDIHALAASSDERDMSWVRHASGTVRTHEEDPAGHVACDIESLRREFDHEVSPNDIFKVFAALGIEYGPNFRAIEQVWKQTHKSLGRIRLPNASVSESQRYTFHPILLDACFQLAGVATSDLDGAGGDPWVPIGLDRLELYGGPGAELWGLAETISVDSQSAAVNVSIMTSEGKRIAQVSNLRLRKTKADTFSDDTDSVAQWFYRVEWRPTDTIDPGVPPAEDIVKTSEIKDRLQASLPVIANEYNLRSYQAALRALETLSVHYVSAAFRNLGWELRRGERFSAEARADELGITQRHRRLFSRLLEILAEEGIVASVGPEWEVTDPAAARPAERLLLSGRALVEAELALLERCGEKLPEVLRGRCDPVDLLFPDGDLTLAGRLYEASPGARAMNTLVQQTVSFTMDRLQRKPQARILEIGAGTGATTSAIVSCLPEERIEYVFTDISPWFTAKARERFSGLSFMKYELLDIERDPTTQGFQAGQFDVVVAANVLHATRDLRQTLENVRTLLRQNGLLILLEGTSRVRWVDLIFGLTEGWWRFSDSDLRPSYPLLTIPAWESLLGQVGFADIAPVSPFLTSLNKDTAESALIIARAVAGHTEERRGNPPWVICADRHGVGKALAERLRAQGQPCHLVFAASEFSLLGDEDYELNPGSEQDFHRLFSSLAEHATTEIHGLVFLWGLDLDDPGSEIEDAHRLTCGSILQLIKAVASAKFKHAPSLWLVTRGAVPACGSMGPGALSQAPLWGMANVIALEHPELRCVRVDLDPNDNGDVSEILLNELMSQTAEDQIAVRDGARYAARLVRHQVSVDGSHNQQLLLRADASYLITGGSRGLGLLVARWMVDQGARQIILLGRGRPDDSASHAIQELQDRGTIITTVEVDVTDLTAMTRLMNEIDTTMAPLRGIVHAAGILDDGILLNLTWDRFKNVLAPKTIGAWNLHTLAAASPLDFFIMFSSTVSVLGSPGQANHAAANAYLDALAHTRQAQGLPGLSINWGAWSDVGSAINKGIDARLETRGIGTISPQLGLEALRTIMSSSKPQVAVAPVEWSQFCKSAGSSTFINDFRTADVEAPKPRTPFLQQFAIVPPKDKHAFLLEHVRCQVALVRGVPASEIDLTQGLFELGLDSLMAIDLRKTLEESLECSLPSTIAFDYPTVEALVDYMARDVLFLERAPDAPVSVPDPKAELSAALSGFTAAEIAARLNDKLLELKQGRAK
jgi:acyl transferase domain-containing protein/ubiquinone/menaquinone biosynthesis C-methylase UbiE/acyl carrier protein